MESQGQLAKDKQGGCGRGLAEREGSEGREQHRLDKPGLAGQSLLRILDFS